MASDFRRDLAVVVLGSFLLGASLSGLDYLAREYTTHKQRMEQDPIYRVQYVHEREQKMLEAEKQLVIMADSLAHKYKIPFLDYLLN